MVVEFSLWQLAAAYAFIVILLLIVRSRGIPREKDILVGSLRMTVQLFLIGYILAWMLENPHPLLTIGAIFLMLAFAIHNITRRVRTPMKPALVKVAAVSISIGTLTTLFFFILVVIGLSPWFEPRYFIPIAGMLIGNSMTGISLGVDRLVEGMEEQRAQVETALMLGAEPRLAAKPVVDSAFDSAIIPTINSMMGMGIVFLPGMMTGQILSGISPVIAIQYQIAVMLGIVGSTSLTVILFVYFGFLTFFNNQQQLVD